MYILPIPIKTITKHGKFLLSYDSYICVNNITTTKLIRQVEMFTKSTADYLGYELEITASKGKKGDIVISLDNNMDKDSYHLDTTGEMISLIGDETGLWYGMQTLLQMIQQDGASIQKMIIDDKPEIKNRGFYLDVTRGRIPKLEWLKKLVDKMAFYKLNQLQLYIEHTYLFRDIPELWRDDTPLTAIEIMELDRYCNERNIELVPSLSTFGHLEKLLSTKKYSHLCELENSYKVPFSVFGRMRHHTIDATNDESIELIKSLLLEFMNLFSSKQFNICADETFDMGKGRGKEYADKYGKDKLYIKYVSELAQFIIDNGRRPMFWGDVILGFPEMIKELPKEMICLNWGYAWNQSEEESKKFNEVGATQYCCPGCCGWSKFINLYEDAYNNIKRMCTYAKKYNAIGVLNTDWGDFLHINHLDFSVVGMIYGASFSWNLNIPSFDDINKQISKLEYCDYTESLVNIVSKAEEYSVFNWFTACRFKDMKLGVEENPKMVNDSIIKELDVLKEADSKNSELISIEEKLYDIMKNIDIEKRKEVYPFVVALRGIQLFNIIGKFVCSIEYAVQPDNLPNAFTLAEELEKWLYHYKKIYRSVSKEGELYRIQDLVCFYSDWLRDNT